MNSFLNVTCMSLFIKSTKTNSPFFSITNTNHYPLISFQKSVFSKLFAPILLSHHFNSRFFINFCSFSDIINSALIFEAGSTIKQKEYHESIMFENDSNVLISNCIFSSMNLEIKNKSAIITFVPINIDNSLFQEIKGETGSCINSNSTLILKYSDFKNNLGQNGGCFFINSNSIHDTNIKYSIFYQNKAKYFSLFFRKSLGDLSINKCNISNCEASECVGVFENNGAYFYMDFSILEECKAAVHHGGIILREPQKVSISKCTFYKMEQHSILSNTASAIFISNGKNDNNIIESEFINCVNSGSYTISFENCQSLTIYKCVFSDTYFHSIHPNPTIIKIDCNFEADLTFNSLFLSNEIGYGAQQNKTQNDEINEILSNKLNRERLILMIRNISIRFAISFIFAFLLASVINHFHTQSKHAFRLKSQRDRL